jgi:2-dehydropantoate 2-reductase
MRQFAIPACVPDPACRKRDTAHIAGPGEVCGTLQRTMKLLIVGAGSVGGYFGARLAAAGRDVTFLVRPRRAGQLSRGLTIRTNGSDTVVPVKVIVGAERGGPFDAILLAVKAYQLADALEEIRKHAGADTMILPVLNGMKHIDTLRAQFGRHRVIGGFAQIVTSVDEEGRIVDQGAFHDLVYGEWDGTQTERILELDRHLQGAGFSARLSAHIEREMWEKWAFLSSMAAITCLMYADIGQVARTDAGPRFAESLFAEVAAVIAAAGQPLSDGFRKRTLSLLTDRTSTLTSSMFRDMKAGRPVELDQIVGDLIARGSAQGLSTPLLASVLARLQVYEGSR